MAERLTEQNKTGWVLKLDDPQNEFEARQQLMSKFKLACEKLGKLEDILEKYGIESVEELEQELKIAHEIERLKDKNIDLNNAIIVFNKNFIKDYIREINKLKVEADTWQKACELACEKEDDCYVYDSIHKAYEFYQQAKMEGNGE